MLAISKAGPTWHNSFYGPRKKLKTSQTRPCTQLLLLSVRGFKYRLNIAILYQWAMRLYAVNFNNKWLKENPVPIDSSMTLAEHLQWAVWVVVFTIFSKDL